MERRERKNAVTVLAPAKLNLALDVVGLLPNGYHALDMTMQTITLYERVMLRRSAGLSLRLPGSLVQPNDKNTAIKAALAFFHYTGLLAGVEITIYKNVPVRAGMAGGSSDAAAVLFGVNKMFRLGLTTEELMQRGVKIGADVPYCILRGTALSEGIGEVLTSLPPVPQCQVLVAKPGINVSTKFVYENLHANDLKPEQHPDIDGMIQAIQDQDLQGIAGKLGNVLETVTVKEYPVIQEIKDKMVEFGAIGSLMSGSGPTVFGLFTNPKAAQQAYEELRYGESSGLAKQVYLTNFYNQKEENNHGKQA